jgi:putative transposase
MLNATELLAYYNSLDLPLSGRKYIDSARVLSPTEEGSSGVAVATGFQSRKSAEEGAFRTMPTASRTVEFPAACMYEMDPKVLEWYSQPPELDICYHDPITKINGRWQHRPDFLVLHVEAALLIEWKGLTWLRKQQSEYPERYTHDDSGWHSREVEELAESMGLQYQLKCSADLPQKFAKNVEFLAPYMSSDWPSLAPEVLAAIKAALRDTPYIRFRDLLKIGTGHTCIDQDVEFDINRQADVRTGSMDGLTE